MGRAMPCLSQCRADALVEGEGPNVSLLSPIPTDRKPGGQAFLCSCLFILKLLHGKQRLPTPGS